MVWMTKFAVMEMTSLFTRQDSIYWSALESSLSRALCIGPLFLHIFFSLFDSIIFMYLTSRSAILCGVSFEDHAYDLHWVISYFVLTLIKSMYGKLFFVFFPLQIKGNDILIFTKRPSCWQLHWNDPFRLKTSVKLLTSTTPRRILFISLYYIMYFYDSFSILVFIQYSKEL